MGVWASLMLFLYVICTVNVKSISSYFSLQNNKCVCDIANTKDNNNFEIIKGYVTLKQFMFAHCTI